MEAGGGRYTPLRPGRHRLPREFIVNSQRDRILDAIAEECLAKRYEAVSVADVVGRARVSRSTFYELFKDKEDCFLAAYDAILGKFMSTAMVAYRTPGLEWRRRIRGAVEAILAFLAAEPAFAWMCIVEAPAAGPRAVERYMSAVVLLASLLDEGRAEAEAGESIPASVPSALVGGLAMVVHGEIVNGRTEALPSIAPDFVYAVLVPFLGRDAALREANATAAAAGSRRV
ncbi:MAG: TetR/AcrR family transcriptional regulator [Solirubrobacterales bacterium]